MKLGVLSDTHNNIKNVRDIVKLFNERKVSRIVHTGDITQSKTLDALSYLDAPLFGVYGNNDVERDALMETASMHNFYFQDPPLELELNDQKIIIVHDPRDLEGALTTQHSLALHGHTHMLRIERTNSQLIFNPGECAGHMRGLNAIGIVDLDNLDVELLKF
ncbi:MAG: hypothetical protein CMD74_00165 [Gammaproteobacteria bacterium]|jgi:putative phosphoesterase|nr:hypothetical protein [Gammaproteobacteria bacterium]|tara:strand:- start:14 stop:499 length:486 start_codon:yes stop_codon:yes gene_type:complete